MGGEGGGLIWKFAKILWGKKFFLDLWGHKPLWGSYNYMGGVIFITKISLFHFFKNIQLPENWIVSVKNFIRRCECISSCYLPISSNLLKNTLRKTSFFVLFELLPTGLLWAFVTTQHEWVNNFPEIFRRTLMKK